METNDIFEKVINIDRDLLTGKDNQFIKNHINTRLREYTNSKLNELNIFVGKDITLENMLLILSSTIYNKKEIFDNYTYLLLGEMGRLQHTYIPWVEVDNLTDAPMITFTNEGFVDSLITDNSSNPVNNVLFVLDTFNNVFFDEKIYRGDKILQKETLHNYLK